MFDNWRSGSLEDATKEFMRLRRGRLEKGKRKKKHFFILFLAPSFSRPLRRILHPLSPLRAAVWPPVREADR